MDYLIKKFSHRLIYWNAKKEKGKMMMYKITSLIIDLFSNIDPRRILKKEKIIPLQAEKRVLNYA